MKYFSRKYLLSTGMERGVLYYIEPPFLITLNYLLLGDSYFQLPLFIWVTLVSFINGIFAWGIHNFAVNVLRDIIPNYHKIGKRLAIQLVVFIILTTAAEIMLYWLYSLLGFFDTPFSWQAFKGVFVAGVLFDIIALFFHEGLYAFHKWQATALEAEQLKKSHLQSQLEGLKSQVNPHFLFNSLNSLSALIYKDPDKAGTFLDEMSKVYRYLLRTNENELIPLKAEVQFLDSFFHMLKTRYEEGIKLNVHIQEQHLDYLIPPLTLQMLIENAVKHNVISRDRPLQIDVFTDLSHVLTVSNNIQKKSTKVLSNGIGLQNIISKYHLLNQSEVLIKNDEKFFTVELPLFNPQER